MKLISAYLEDENYSELKAPCINRNVPDIDETVASKPTKLNLKVYEYVGQENDVFKCNIDLIYFSLSLSNKYYIHA